MSGPSTGGALDGIVAVGALAEPVRRRLYEYVVAAEAPVGRDEAARALGIGRPLAAFHLDRLVDDGLLVADYRRLTGRSGPGAGRPAKIYRRAPAEISVSLPARRYEIPAAVFADALERLEPGGPPPAVLEAAKARGRRLGGIAASDTERVSRETADRRGPRADRRGPQTERSRLVEQLDRLGFEPTVDAGRIRLRNCPFDALAREHRDLTCPANRAFLEGVVEGMGCDARAVLSPEPGYCCVVIEEAGE